MTRNHDIDQRSVDTCVRAQPCPPLSADADTDIEIFVTADMDADTDSKYFSNVDTDMDADTTIYFFKQYFFIETKVLVNT